jgi:hypothetical protein
LDRDSDVPFRSVDHRLKGFGIIGEVCQHLPRIMLGVFEQGVP